ncbi:MAG: hypothetical protein JO261_12650 [Alphaproteobacteria bacterium]|nr:hypothetical protein [Alphaproteobacteria bacterium]MBV9694540.1 hypothetical protein [Alphaproteobacteria bacterium]
MQDEKPPASADAAAWARWAGDASRRRRWMQALERWSQCIVQFGARPYWLAQRAHALRHLDRLDEAEALFEALALDRPANHVGLEGLAQIAADRGAHEQALALLDKCLATYADGPIRSWNRQRAQALLNLGRIDEAQAVALPLLEDPDANVDDKLLYVRVARQASIGRPDREARRRELARLVSGHLLPELPGIGLQLLSTVASVAETREALRAAERKAFTEDEIEGCMMVLPRVMPRASCGASWERLYVRAREIDAPELELRLLLALERHGEFVARFDALQEALRPAPRFALLRGLRNRLARPRREVFAEEKVFGIGLSRTGTTSLSDALEILGFDSAHWVNPLTYQLLSDTDFFLFGAATDCCVSPEFEKLHYQYPNARFVLTRRPLESWLASFARHHEKHSGTGVLEGLRALFDGPDNPFMFHHAALEYGLYLNAPSLAEAWRQFEARVRHFFADKPGKLLELDVFAGQGWNELCGFLGRPVPSKAFPRLNAAPP